jgi:hypothetical protein
MSLDVVEATRNCASELAKLGLTDWSEKLEEAIGSGSTGGEIVMAIRWNLRELRNSAELPENVNRQIEEILYAIDGTGW